jgi:hypothetical protein
VANARSSKRDIDRVKKERAALKRERRQHSQSESHDSTVDEEPWASSAPPPMSEGDVLAALNLLHVRFDAGELSFDQFESSKSELFQRLADR